MSLIFPHPSVINNFNWESKYAIDEVTSICSLLELFQVDKIETIGFPTIYIVDGLNILMSVFRPQINHHMNTCSCSQCNLENMIHWLSNEYWYSLLFIVIKERNFREVTDEWTHSINRMSKFANIVMCPVMMPESMILTFPKNVDHDNNEQLTSFIRNLKYDPMCNRDHDDSFVLLLHRVLKEAFRKNNRMTVEKIMSNDKYHDRHYTDYVFEIINNGDIIVKSRIIGDKCNADIACDCDNMICVFG